MQFVYMLVFAGDYVKIGKTSDPGKRFQNILRLHPMPLIEKRIFRVEGEFPATDGGRASGYLRSWHTGTQGEMVLHKLFSRYLIPGKHEWFLIPADARQLFSSPQFQLGTLTFNLECGIDLPDKPADLRFFITQNS